MSKSTFEFYTPDQNDRLNEAFETETGHHHDGADSRKVPFSVVVAGVQGFLATTCTIAVAAIAATDVVQAQVVSWATVAHVTKVAITAGTGFIATLNQDPGSATISYLVLKNS